MEEIKALGGEAIANGGSVSDRAGAQSIVKDAVATFGTVDILINNAGILRDKTFNKMQLDDFELVVTVHLLGSAYCTQAAWPVMAEQGLRPHRHDDVVERPLRQLRPVELRRRQDGPGRLDEHPQARGWPQDGIKVNTIAPVAATRMTDDLGMPEEVFKALKPELVTPAVLFLCSEDAPAAPSSRPAPATSPACR